MAPSDFIRKLPSEANRNMPKIPLSVIVLAAGKGTRMNSAVPKVLHQIAGRAMVDHVIATAESLEPRSLVVVVGPDMELVAETVAPYPTVLQENQSGTADAVKVGIPALGDTGGETVLVLFGADPMIRSEALADMVKACDGGAAVVVLGFRAANPSGYGRLIVNEAGSLQAIVEDRDATENQRAINLCNAGAMAIKANFLVGWLARIGNENAKSEYYLTDIVDLARQDGCVCNIVETDEADALGVDSRAQLARAEAHWQARRRLEVMDQGVTLLDPESVYFAYDTTFGRDVVVEPNVVFGPGVEVASGVKIKAFSHIEGARIGAGAIIGPFARLRPNTELGEDVHIGNFVELKNTTMSTGSKANHLAYVGDSNVGKKANIGAGTITCNYDGFEKHRTVVGDEAFIGSNSALVAPVSIGAGAIVGAGSTVARDVPNDALSIERSKQINLAGRAKEFREERASAKARKRE